MRTASEVAAVAASKPFPAAQLEHAGAFCVGFLNRPPDAAAARALMTLKTDIDDFQIRGREVFWLCKTRQSESTFSNAVMERALKVRATLRGMNTLVRLAARHGPS